MSSIVIQGDTSGSITVAAPSVAGTHTLTLPKATGNIATDATVGLGMKNLIINGDMRIAQRATNRTGVNTSAYRTVDRYYFICGSLGVWTESQSTDAPDGFGNSWKIECTTADASPAAGDYLGLQHRIEGQNLQHLKKGTANAESVTLSFWIKSNKTGTLQANLRDFDNSRQIGNTYTINSANTWEKKTITFTGDTTGTLDNDNNASISLEWWFDSGSNYNSGSVPTSWQTYNDTNRNAGGTINLADSTSNYINITGVQLEVGENATPFENRMYGTELALCQRYCQVLGGGQFEVMMVGAANSTSSSSVTYKPPVNFRTTPSMSYSDIGDFQLYRFTGATAVAVTAANLVAIISSSQYVYVDWTASVSTGEVVYLRSDNTTSSKLIFSAEL
jgi:hypothetical protein